MTKHVCKISRLNFKRLLRKLQKNVRGLLYFAAPCRTKMIFAVLNVSLIMGLNIGETDKVFFTLITVYGWQTKYTVMLLPVSFVVFVHETMSTMHWLGYIGYQLFTYRVQALPAGVQGAKRSFVPFYITDMLLTVTTLDSMSPCPRLTIMTCSFPVGQIAAPRAWNSLPSQQILLGHSWND